jgi:hypothetical protein
MAHDEDGPTIVDVATPVADENNGTCETPK